MSVESAISDSSARSGPKSFTFRRGKRRVTVLLQSSAMGISAPRINASHSRVPANDRRPCPFPRSIRENVTSQDLIVSTPSNLPLSMSRLRGPSKSVVTRCTPSTAARLSPSTSSRHLDDKGLIWIPPWGSRSSRNHRNAADHQAGVALHILGGSVRVPRLTDISPGKATNGARYDHRIRIRC